MSVKRNSAISVLILVASVLVLTGCGGINAGGSVSPASFFLPGLLKNDAPKTLTPAVASWANSVAAAQ